MRKEQRGFSLIELVVVIVIIGILAITVAPRFLNLQKDARVAALLGAKSAFLAVDSLVYTKAVLQGQTEVDASTFNIDLDNNGSADVAGYFGHIKYVIPAKELSGLDPSLTITKSPGEAFSTAYFLISYLNRPPADNIRCMVEIFYPSVSDANASITTNVVDEDC
ncbi:prepilin-type N-terminal cleavage/methylation domain-containing protein [Vibrio sp. NTOU-M3]|uniref:prepilin-type N-terminal cleavage/methylation domain-containing protein n=1 Tax=unclassified Vibrio TaxID=2614977 RepID=UPI00349F4F29